MTSNGMGVIDNRRAGDVIGEIGVLTNEPRSANCTAMAETTVLFISQTDFWDLLERNSLLAVSVIRVLVPKLVSYAGRR